MKRRNKVSTSSSETSRKLSSILGSGHSSNISEFSAATTTDMGHSYQHSDLSMATSDTATFFSQCNNNSSTDRSRRTSQMLSLIDTTSSYLPSEKKSIKSLNNQAKAQTTAAIKDARRRACVPDDDPNNTTEPEIIPDSSEVTRAEVSKFADMVANIDKENSMFKMKFIVVVVVIIVLLLYFYYLYVTRKPKYNNGKRIITFLGGR